MPTLVEIHMSDEQLLAHAVDALAQPGELAQEQIGALSHLVSTDLEAVAIAWSSLPADRRLGVRPPRAHSERKNAGQDFNAIYGVALDDSEPRVRRLAVDSIVTENGPVHLERLTDLAVTDPDPFVREAAVTKLAPYSLLAELGKLPDPWRD